MKFKSMLEVMIELDLSTGVLATAIEQHGVYGWDRYGRYMHFKVDTEDGKRALDVLANQAAFPSGDPDLISPLQEDRFGVSPLEKFGWPDNELPDFQAISEGLPKVPRPQAVARTENARLVIICALLDFIEGKYGDRLYSSFESEKDFIAFLAVKLKGIPGGSAGNLRKHFQQAREHIQSV